mmetsp:Transcript_22391/g.44843  ORF Transcript_22391/g.44843 Transcript_22391/m.44843 type:complete len:566 (-) Transcript_22391:380-2077(-)
MSIRVVLRRTLSVSAVLVFTIMSTYHIVRHDMANMIENYTGKKYSSPSAHMANTANKKDGPANKKDGPSQQRQNIVLVLIDDLGIGDLKCYGSSFHETPNIDALAAEGVRFTSAYAAHPKCGPARLALFSGVYPARMGSPVSGHELEKYGMPNAFKCQKKMGDYKMRLPLERTSMGGAFKLNGYRTGYHGKWHFGDASGRGSPLDHGFEVSIGATHKGSVQSHFAPYTNPDHIKQVPPPPMSEPRPDGTYMADHLTDETIGTIKKFKNDPFLVVLAHYAVHTPIEAPEDLVDPYEKKRNLLDETDQFTHDHNAVYRTSQDHATYGGMMTAVDNSLGRVMQALKDMGLDKNTTVVFTSDNGGLASSIKEKNMPDIPTTNHPYRHGKTWLYEGGIRVPLIVHAPDRKPVEGGESAFLTTGTDMYPTLLDLAGLPLQPNDHVDGISFAEAVTTNMDGAVRGGPLFWHFAVAPDQKLGRGQPACSAVLEGRWKLLDFYTEGKGGKRELYDIRNDPYEKNNVSKENPEITRRMFIKIKEWRRTWADEKFYEKEMKKGDDGICVAPEGMRI